MRFSRSLLTACAVAAVMTLPATGDAVAAPAGPGAGAKAFDLAWAKQGLAEPAQRRRRRNFRRGVGVGVGAAIIGGFLLSEAARAEHRRTRRAAWERCADRFRSFDWETGTIINRYGDEVVCPYLD